MAITKEEIVAKCSADLIASRDCQAIAQLVSAGRTRPSKLEVGNGTILNVLEDMEVANALLDVLHNDQRFKYVVPLLEQGRLIISSPLVQLTLNSFVPTILTQEQANKLGALGKEPDPVTAQEVAELLYNNDGSIK